MSRTSIVQSSLSGGEVIAVVGLACRFPAAASAEDFWRSLCDGRDAVREVPPERWGTPAGKGVARKAALLEEIDRFDAGFFGISPRETAQMDPQQRLLLEVAWEALENAGIPAEGLRGRPAGVFVGGCWRDWADLHLGLSAAVTPYTGTGQGLSLLANRISYVLGLRGPSLTIDTASSSSLVAVHLACRSLLGGEVDLAFAGGVSLLLSWSTQQALEGFGALSRQGRSRPFDADADGYGRGEGAGVVVLKRLSDALVDGDPIYCVIRGGAVNHDGTGGGLTVPSADAQAELLRRACAEAGVDPAEVQYVEAHGSGTRVGDPVEAAALGRVFGRGRSPERPLLLGSVKGNIGHLEAAAGVAGLIKVALALRHRTLPPSLHCPRPHPAIPFQELGLRVLTQEIGWREGERALAGVSSFGWGGTNCHLVLGEAPPPVPSLAASPPPGAEIFLLSARSELALRELAGRTAETLAAGPEVPLSALCATASRHRSHHEHRLALVAASTGELARRLANCATREESGDAAGRACAERPPRLAFVFPGQGTQWAGMGRELRQREPVVREMLDRCHELFRTLGRLSLLDELDADEERSRLGENAIAQPALFALQVAVAQLWRSWVGEPDAVVGHSVGEVAAAYVAGALTLEEGARVAFHRGRLMQSDAARGAMAAIELPAAEVEALLRELDGEVTLAALNAPASTTVSGDADAVERLIAMLEGRGVSCRHLRVGFAFHGPRMQPAADALVRELRGLEPRPPVLPLVSSVTGRRAVPGDFAATYWGRNVREPVRFARAAEVLLDEGCEVFLEIGPHPALTRSVGEIAAARFGTGRVTALASLRRGGGERASLLRSLGALWAGGCSIDWRAVHPYDGPQVVLPSYPWQRERFWLEPDPERTLRSGAMPGEEVALSPASPPPSRPDLPARLAAVEPSRRRDLLIAYVQTEVARVLGLDPSRPLEPRRRLFDAGLDSMLAFELRARLETALGQPLRPTALFNHATAEAIADHLAAELGEGSALREELRLAATKRPEATEPIAVVGLACRFPGGADDPEAFWRLLHDGVDAVTEVPADRWAPASLEEVFPGALRARWGGFLTDPGGFDAAFFDIPPGEAATIDPQQRLLLEVAWEALESAGVAPDRLTGSATGVFVGAMTNDWALAQLRRGGLAGISPQLFAGTEDSFLAGRLSYVLGLQGPSLVLSTACSSSLVAVHLACRSLRSGECDLALAGGVNVMASPEWQLSTASLRALAADGRCKTFDAAADGYVRGEGCGVVVLKRLSAARAEGDTVWAVIRGTAVNHDGASGGLTVPSGAAQQDVVRQALAAGGVPPAAVSYVEAHGSGTALGDPIELEALHAALGEGRRAPLAVGSVKTNIGHLEAAAGIAGLIKVILALRHGEIPPSLHFRSLNPHVRCPEGALTVPTLPTPWLTAGGPRVAGVSSFGLSGANAHVVVEEAPMPLPDRAVPFLPGQLLVLSARSEAALEAATDRLAARLEEDSALSLADIAGTLQSGRAEFRHRRVLVAGDRADAASSLLRRDARRVLTGIAPAKERPVAFLLPGVGDHYPNMALDLYRSEPRFREEVDRCAELLLPHLGEDLRDLLLPGRSGAAAESPEPEPSGPDLRRLLGRGSAPDGPAWEAARRLQRTELAQPAVFVIELALARLLESWGLRPAALIGYSLGEYTAACLAGVFSVEDALSLVATRARLIAAMPPGAMLAVPLAEDGLRPLLDEFGLSLAAVNTPELGVAAGPVAAVAALRDRLAENGVAATWLPTTHAFHSWMMEPAAAELAELVRAVRRSPPRIPLLLNRTGTWALPDQVADPVSWARHLCETVRFADGVGELIRSRPDLLLLEVGPGQSLSSFALQVAGSSDLCAVPAMRHAFDPTPDRPFLLGAVGRLWLRGVAVSWEGLRGGPGRRLPLPTYPFEHQRFWLESEPAPPSVPASAPVRREDPADWFWLPIWRQSPPVAVREAAAARWLVLADPGPFADALIRRLREAGGDVEVVRSGSGFSQLGVGEHAVAPTEPDDYLRLLEALGEPPQRVVHLWDLDDASSEAGGAIDRGFHGLLALTRALARRAAAEEVDITVITRCAVRVTGAERLRPEGAAAHGAGRVIPQEYPRLACRVLDLDLPLPRSRREAEMTARLAAELAAPAAHPLVAYRGGDRWVRGFEPVRLESRGPARLRRRGVYLLTGGLGQVGFELAQFLAREVSARLVLTGRTTLPERKAWDGWLAEHDAEDPASVRIRRVRRLESLGAEVEVLAADAADEPRMRTVIAHCIERFGALNGVVQATGDTRQEALRYIPETGRSDAAEHFRAKLHAARTLESVLKDRRLDFVLLCSSISTVLGGMGFAAYAAANLCMETLAERCDSAGDTPWLAVAWDTWRLGERLRQGAPVGGNVGVTLAGLDMSPDEGCEVFRRLLDVWPSPRVVISTGDLETRLAQWVTRAPSEAPPPARPGARGPRLARPELPTPYAVPEGELERTIAELWEEVLGFERVGAHDNFFSLGGHSLLAARFLSRLRERIDLDLPVRAVFEASTPSALAGSVAALRWMGSGPGLPVESGVIVEGEL